MPTYLVESYQPRARSSAAATVAALLGSRSGARLRWSLVLPEEDLCLHVLDAPSAEVVREATVLVALACQRISEVLLLSGEPLEAEGRSAASAAALALPSPTI